MYAQQMCINVIANSFIVQNAYQCYGDLSIQNRHIVA